MKRITVALLLAVAAVALTSPIFGQGHGSSPSPSPSSPPIPPFVEASVPEGKAILYIYPGRLNAGGSLLLGDKGPIGVISQSTYCVYAADPGTIRLWIVSSGNGIAGGFKLEVVAGKVYYVKVTAWPDFKLIPDETARKEVEGLTQATE